jgi:hypothetical protein
MNLSLANKVASVTLLFACLAHASLSVAQDRDARSARNPFVGAWRLVSLDEPDAAGEVHRSDCTGLLVYTSDGHMSVQVMYRNDQGRSGGSPVQYAQGGYEASFGTYRVDDVRTFTFHVEGALVRSLIGKDLKRLYQISGNQLVVTPPDPKEHWKVVWERY